MSENIQRSGATCLAVTVIFFFCLGKISAQKTDFTFPRDAIVELIPYLNYNNITGPYLAGQFFRGNTVYSASLGTSYQDLFHSDRWNEYNVKGIKNFIVKAEGNAFFIQKSEQDDHLLRVNGARVGFTYLSSFFHKKFKAADTALAQRGGDLTETYLYYPTKYVNTNYSNAMLHFGYGWQKSYWGFLDDEKMIGRIRETYADVFLTAPSLINYSHVNQDGTEFTGYGEPSFKTLVGGRVGIKWTSLRAVGWVFGMETGLRPGICHADSRYGPGTNVGAIKNYYFMTTIGLTVGKGINVSRY